MAVSKFRRGQATYTCAVCKKLTRNTGDEGSTGLCRDCFDLAGFENSLSDNGLEEFLTNSYVVEASEILHRRPELRKHFGELAEATQEYRARQQELEEGQLAERKAGTQ